MDSGQIFDLFVIGGGINGAAIARDAAGRGLSVALADRGDFGAGTSSASSKLLHGGLRYLEFGAVGLVQKALAERAVIFDIAPHLARPMSFVIPRIPNTRADWQLRSALMVYDRLGDRGGMPASQTIRLRQDTAGRGIDAGISKGWRYWDGWIDDSRMVIAILRDAARRGARIYPRNAVASASYGDHWRIALGSGETIFARHLVNASGPWAAHVARDVMTLPDPPSLRLVQGSHIVVERLTSATDALVIQQPDRRIVFMVPHSDRYLLIGTTETEFSGDPGRASPTSEEIVYLLMAANSVLTHPLQVSDIVHAFAGVRPLVVEPGKSARETTRDWKLHEHEGVPALTVVGGKITTHRLLAESVLKIIAPKSKAWTQGSRFPEADFSPSGEERNREAFDRWLDALPRRFPYYDPEIVRTFGQRYGLEAEAMLDEGIGANIGGLHEAELRHFVTQEWAITAEDILWRRTKIGLSANSKADTAINGWIETFLQGARFTAP